MRKLQEKIAGLNDAFACGSVSFRAGDGDLIYLDVANAGGRATLTNYGAHVLSFRPAGGSELFFVSKLSKFEHGAPIRGGVPVCWPYFGPSNLGAEYPSHGFGRLYDWIVESVEELSERATKVVLVFPRDICRGKLPQFHNLGARMTVTVSDTLEMVLETTNYGDSEAVVTQALHTYFAVGDIAKTEVTGLEGALRYDRLTDSTQVMTCPVTFDRETDLIFENASGRYTVIDGAAKRRILLEETGSKSAVVWNPWIAKAKSMADFEDESYRNMVCVETTNVRNDALNIPGGKSHKLGVKFSVGNI